MSQGLWVAFMGMALVFLALGMLMVVIMLLDRAFRPRPARQEPTAVEPSAESPEQDKALAAAVGLAVALALRTEYRSPQGGHQRPSDKARSQPPPPSAWRLLGRRHQTASPARRWP